MSDNDLLSCTNSLVTIMVVTNHRNIPREPRCLHTALAGSGGCAAGARVGVWGGRRSAQGGGFGKHDRRLLRLGLPRIGGSGGGAQSGLEPSSEAEIAPRVREGCEWAACWASLSPFLSSRLEGGVGLRGSSCLNMCLRF